jgi:apolipoprotein N-acyltransferase
MDTLSATPEPIPARGRLDGRWARVGLALLAGALAALAHPPFGVLPGLLGYPLLMILSERSATTRGGFWMGWLAGFAYFLISCWWVAEAFFVNPEQIWMAPFAASLLPAGLGLGRRRCIAGSHQRGSVGCWRSRPCSACWNGCAATC